MLRKQHPQDDPFEDIDEHDQPTEQMSQIILSPYRPPAAMQGQPQIKPQDDNILPTPQPGERPFPQPAAYNSPQQNSPQRSPDTPVYPYLPPSPLGNSNGRTTGGATASGIPAHPKAAQPRRSSFPLLVGVFFVAVQLLLLLRFVLQLFGQLNSNFWENLVYILSSIFVYPFTLLLQKLNLPILVGADSYSLLALVVAILVYGLLSRILVRFLKALLNSR
jgi:hypothetical protein